MIFVVMEKKDMIKVREFCDDGDYYATEEFEDFCRDYNIQREDIISVQYSVVQTGDAVPQSNILLVYDSGDNAVYQE